MDIFKESFIDWKETAKEIPFHKERVLIWVPGKDNIGLATQIATFYHGLSKDDRAELLVKNDPRASQHKMEDEGVNENLHDYAFIDGPDVYNNVSHWAYISNSPYTQFEKHPSYAATEHEKIFHFEDDPFRWIRLVVYTEKYHDLGFKEELDFDSHFYHKEFYCRYEVMDTGLLTRTPKFISQCPHSHAYLDVYVEPKDKHELRLNYELLLAYINEHFII